eukprot:TRINITY_DN5746_c0_g1_i3.p1 TRINITY_DN5746_c0_g1~~TRINITY_DN5746_c0_g1_i3.p1  ORF type:complete len:948 (+),score=156.04 TRINITY_DN5746_c0_g1_i3:642-3485(+)
MLSGEMPSFEGVPMLFRLSVTSNGFSGTVPDLSPLPRIEQALLDDNDFIGTVPLQNSSLLQYYYTGYNYLEGTIPDFEGTPSMAYISSDANRLRGSIPDFRFIPNLRLLTFSANKLSGSLPAFSNMRVLSIIYLMVNELSGQFPDLRACPLLYHVWVTSNEFSGTIPLFLRNPFLSELLLGRNRYEQPLPRFFLKPELESIQLYGNRFTGTIHGFEENPKLKRLLLHDNQLEGTVPLFESLSFLADVDLSYNKLEGMIPIINSSSLVNYNLAGNKLSGPFPNYVPSNLIVTMDFSGNRLSGSVPVFLNMTSLKLLNLASNNFTSFIGLEGCPLFYLNIFNNSLSGSLPRYLPYDMSIIDFSRNKFTGEIPEIYSLATQLSSFFVSDNNLRANEQSPRKLPSFMQPTQQYQLLNDSLLFKCPTIQAFDGKARVDVDAAYYYFEYCQCLPGTYGTAGQCIECPSDLDCDCPGANLIRKCWPSPFSYQTDKLLRCPFPDACDVQADGTLCKEGYEDHLCSRCEEGYFLQGRECLKCDETNAYILFIVALIVFGVFVAYLLKTPPSDTGVIKILLFHVQTLSILSSNVLDLGAETSSFYDALSAPMNASFPSKDCLQGRLPVYFSVSSKLVIAFILFSIAAGPKPKMVQDHQSNLIFICVFFLHSLYYGASLDIFGAFGCILYDSGESNWYLASFPWLQCSPADEDYKILVSVASVGLLGYLISFPLSMAAIFYRLGDKKNEQDNQRKYGFLYLPYHEKCYWWEVIVTIRRLLIGLILSTVPYDQPYLLAILVFSVLQASILMQHAYWPFRNENENKLEIVSLYMILFSFFVGYVSTLQDLGDLVFFLISVANLLVLAVFLLFYYSALLSFLQKLFSHFAVALSLICKPVCSCFEQNDRPESPSTKNRATKSSLRFPSSEWLSFITNHNSESMQLIQDNISPDQTKDKSLT